MNFALYDATKFEFPQANTTGEQKSHDTLEHSGGILQGLRPLRGCLPEANPPHRPGHDQPKRTLARADDGCFPLYGMRFLRADVSRLRDYDREVRRKA